MSEYLPILMYIVTATVMGVAMLLLPKLVAPARPYAAKLSPYECGFEAFDNARGRFDIRFYLVAILFVVFDLEVAFLFPWVMALHEIGWEGFTSMMIFLSVLTVGFIYEWRQGALDWE